MDCERIVTIMLIEYYFSVTIVKIPIILIGIIGNVTNILTVF